MDKLSTNILGILLLSVIGSEGASLMTMSDFESGTDGWMRPMGSPNQTTTTVVGGSNVLSVTSSGTSSAGSRLIVPNTTADWVGDYAAAGITGVTMDLINNSGITLSFRVGLDSASGGRWVSSNPVVLTSGASGTYRFSFAAADMSDAGGSGSDHSQTLAAVNEIRVIHNGALDWKGELVSASFQADNMSLVPEPSAVFLVSLGGVTLLMRRKK